MQRIPCASWSLPGRGGASACALLGEGSLGSQAGRTGCRDRLRPEEGATSCRTEPSCGRGDLRARLAWDGGVTAMGKSRQTETSWSLWLEEAHTEVVHTCTYTRAHHTHDTVYPHMHNTHPCTSHHKHNTDNTLAKVHTRRLHNTFITQGAHTTQCTCAAHSQQIRMYADHTNTPSKPYITAHTHAHKHSRGAHHATCTAYTHEPHTHTTPVPFTPLTQRMGKTHNTHKHIIHITHVHTVMTHVPQKHTAQAPHDNTHRHNAMCTTYMIRARVTQSRCIHT